MASRDRPRHLGATKVSTPLGWLVACGLLACSEPVGGLRSQAVSTEAAARRAAPLIYGRDDRQEVFEHPSCTLQALARDATAALIARPYLQTLPDGGLRIDGPTLSERFDLCPGERFEYQPSVAECTGVLIDSDLVLTAGHCLNDARDCEDFVFVFDYYYRGPLAGPGSDGAEPIDASDVFGCRSIVARRHANNERTRLDFAVVELDRPAVGRTPAPVRRDPPRASERLATIGSTSGLPFKIDDGARALHVANLEAGYFSLDADAFVGSSGSGVFDREGQLVGVIARGGADYETAPDAGCARPVVAVADPPAPHDAAVGASTGEEATHVARAIEGLCEVSRPDSPLCQQSGEDGGHLDAAPRPTAGAVCDGDAGARAPGRAREGSSGCSSSRFPAIVAPKDLLPACLVVGLWRARRRKRRGPQGR